MSRYLMFGCLSLVLSLSLLDTADAGGRRFRQAWRQPPTAPLTNYRQFGGPDQRFEWRLHHNPYEYYQQWYPKYYGSLHSSVIDRHAYPGSDARLRGYAW